MPKTVVKGKEWEYRVRSKHTHISGPRGEATVCNSVLGKSEVSPRKINKYITETFYK